MLLSITSASRLFLSFPLKELGEKENAEGAVSSVAVWSLSSDDWLVAVEGLSPSASSVLFGAGIIFPQRVQTFEPSLLSSKQ